MKVFISQPMRDKTDEQIKEERNKAIEVIKSKYQGSIKELTITILHTLAYWDIKN